MAPEKTVDIGSFSIASNVDKDFTLTVTTSMTLSLPDHFADHLTANELRDQVQAGALWLTRASSCRLTLEIYFERPAEMSVQGDAQRRQLAIEAFQSLPVWCDLGLELRLEMNVFQSNRAPSATSVYYIQHAQRHSGLFVPQGVPCGYLSELSCSFRYAATTSMAPGKAEQTVPRSRNHTPYNLRKLAKTSIEPRSVNTAAFWGLPVDVQAERVVCLTQNALHLTLGTRRRNPGFRCLGGTKPPALLELAPAVWNAQYFQNVVSRAQLIPAISSALGNLMSTQSPVLRLKIESLVPEPSADSGLDKVLDELHRRTQALLLRSARDQKIKTCLSGAQTQSAHPHGLVLSQEGFSVPNASIRNDFTDYASLDLIKETLHGQEDNHLHEAMSGLADHGLMYLVSEGGHGFTAYRADSAEGDGINLGPEEDYLDNDMEGVEWVDYDVGSYTPESLLEYGRIYNENCVDDGIFGLIPSEQEYQEQHLAPDEAYQEHDMEHTNPYGENDSYDHYYLISDSEGGLRPFAHAFEYCPAESNRAAETLEGPQDDFSDFVADEDDIDDEIYEQLGDRSMDPDECQIDPWEPDDGYNQGVMRHGGAVDDEPGPDYTTGVRVHHNDEAEAAEGNTGVDSRRELLQDWSQVPRNYADHGTEDLWSRPRPHPNTFTRALAGYQ